MGQIELALGIFGYHKAVGLQTDPGSWAGFDKQVEIWIQPEFDDRIRSGAQTRAENWVALEMQQSFECLVQQAQTDVPNKTTVEPSIWKVDLANIEVDPYSQKVELVGYWVVLAPLRVVLTGRMVEQIEQLVGLVDFEANHFIQMVD